MKNLFAIYYGKNTDAFSDCVVKRLSAEKSAELDKAAEQAEKLDKKLTAPEWMVYTYFPALVLGLALILVMFFGQGGFSFIYKTRWYFLYVGIAALVYGIFCRAFIMIKKVKSRHDPAIGKFKEKTDALGAECYKELGVPHGAADIDVIMPYVKTDKNGQEVLKRGLTESYINYSFKVFTEGDNVCFADGTQVLALPKDCFSGDRKAQGRIRLPQWNKSEPYNSDRYGEYGVTPGGNGIVVNGYRSFGLSLNGESYEILVPEYDADALSCIING